jgi:hypothetical protein
VALTFEAFERVAVGRVAAIAVRHGNADDLAHVVARREARRDRLHAQMDLFTHEAQVCVAEQGTGQQSGLAGDLEAVADAEHRRAAPACATTSCMIGLKRAMAPATQVVPVAEAAGQDHEVRALQIMILVPEEDRLRAEMVDDGVVRVLVAVRARETG